MKNRLLILIACAFGFSALSLADPNWEDQFAQVCTYDSFCGRLKNQDGTWREFRPEVLAIMKTQTVKDALAKSARQYGVDETSIAMAIISENSLNIALQRHQSQEWIAEKLGITSIPTLSGQRSFSLGIGGIHADTALEAETFVAGLQHRQPRSVDELVKLLADPVGSVEVAAIILREAQDVYAKHGFQISKNPGILATVYNLGHPEARASQAQKEGRLPKVNYFGLFTEKHYDDLKNILFPTPRPPVQAVSGAAVAQKTEPSAANAPKAPLTKQLVANVGLSLAAAPASCNKADDLGEDTNNPSQITFAPPSGTINPGESVTELGRSLDCDSKVWKLVRSSSGVSGWLLEDRLNAGTAFAMAPKKTCAGVADSKCSTRVSAESKPYFLDLESKGREWLKPYSKSASPSFKKENLSCGDSKASALIVASMQASSSFSTMGPTGAPVRKSPEEIRAEIEPLQKFYEQQLDRIASEQGLAKADLFTPKNPYTMATTAIKSALNSTQMCLQSLHGETYYCDGISTNVSQLQSAIVSIPFKKDPSLMDLQTAASTILFAMMSGAKMNSLYGTLRLSYYEPTDEDLKKVTADSLRGALKACADRLSKYGPQQSTPSKASASVSPWAAGAFGGGLGYGMTGYGPGAMSMGNQKAALAPLDMMVANATDQELLDQKFSLLTAARFCHARLNLAEDITATSEQSDASLTCAQSPEVLSFQGTQFMKDFIKANMKDPIVKESMLDETLKLVNFNGPDLWFAKHQGTGTAGKSGKTDFNSEMGQDTDSSYCPARTAEFIEDLLKHNPCVTHVYVPSRWIVFKLRDYSSQVIYRDFEKDDRYLVEYGGSTCGL